MNWYFTSGTGSTSGAGLRASDPDSMCGNAVMFAAESGQILTLGGAPDYKNSTSTNAAHIITIGAPGTTPSVQTLPGMLYQRVYANAIILPNGNVFITGGQSFGMPYVDANNSLVPEMWQMSSNTFVPLATNPFPRNYHSTGLLMLDGRVFTGGGGLCGTCTTNHLNANIYSPPYLFNADGTAATKPVITASPTTAAPGTLITITSDSVLTSASFIRYGSATHTVNTDQRRIGLPLTPGYNSNTYTVVLPSDPGVTLLGYWMLFGMNSQGTPSVASTILVT